MYGKVLSPLSPSEVAVSFMEEDKWKLDGGSG